MGMMVRGLIQLSPTCKPLSNPMYCKVKSPDDPYVTLVKTGFEYIAMAFRPGAFLVDSIPSRKLLQFPRPIQQLTQISPSVQ